MAAPNDTLNLRGGSGRQAEWPVEHAVALTANAAADLPSGTTRGIHCNASGNFRVAFANAGGAESTAVIPAAEVVQLTLLQGATYPYSIRRLISGAGLVGIY